MDYRRARGERQTGKLRIGPRIGGAFKVLHPNLYAKRQRIAMHTFL